MKLETKFQDKDFELGEVVKARVTTYYDENKVVVMADRARGGVSRFEYNSIKDFTDHWTDPPEEPKGYWFIDCAAPYPVDFCEFNIDTEDDKAIGNYFETKEEAEKAVEKLKAWKRLKDKGVKLEIVTIGHRKYLEPTAEDDKTFDEAKELIKDFELIFGGEE